MQSTDREWVSALSHSQELHLLLEQIWTFYLYHDVDECAQLPLLTLPFLHKLMSQAHSSYIGRKSTQSHWATGSLFSASAGKTQWHSCLKSSNGQFNALIISWSTATMWLRGDQFLNEAISWRCLLSLLCKKSCLCSSLNFLKKEVFIMAWKIWIRTNSTFSPKVTVGESPAITSTPTTSGNDPQSYELPGAAKVLPALKGHKNSGVEVDLVRTKWEEVLQDWVAKRGFQSGITYFHKQSCWLFMHIYRTLLVICQKSSGVRSALRRSVTIKKDSGIHSQDKFKYWFDLDSVCLAQYSSFVSFL